jgi:hypothetical protein
MRLPATARLAFTALDAWAIEREVPDPARKASRLHPIDALRHA